MKYIGNIEQRIIKNMIGSMPNQFNDYDEIADYFLTNPYYPIAILDVLGKNGLLHTTNQKKLALLSTEIAKKIPCNTNDRNVLLSKAIKVLSILTNIHNQIPEPIISSSIISKITQCNDLQSFNYNLEQHPEYSITINILASKPEALSYFCYSIGNVPKFTEWGINNVCFLIKQNVNNIFIDTETDSLTNSFSQIQLDNMPNMQGLTNDFNQMQIQSSGDSAENNDDTMNFCTIE